MRILMSRTVHDVRCQNKHPDVTVAVIRDVGMAEARVGLESVYEKAKELDPYSRYHGASCFCECVLHARLQVVLGTIHGGVCVP